ncbi:MAG TPA: hypothetical protein VHP30_11910 [Ignavibacteriales bacterium]|nr:hypothetical protein [Ignavibacteriales bacterium]
MGGIIFWALIRLAAVIFISWIAIDYVEYSFWFSASLLLIYGAVLHPAVIQYNQFREANKEVVESTLCSSCRHFDKSAVLCMKFDEHPAIDRLPCEGLSWEPKNDEFVEED